ncbi:MAG: alpha-galactosidase [Clostridia bacterium]|nr:alpha-galactosidase [Clostridia bacterium]
MPIWVNDNQFHIETSRTSYIFSLYKNRYLTHLYWGKKLSSDANLSYIPTEFIYSRPNATHVPVDETNRVFVSDLAMEFSVVGGGDYATPTLHARYADNSTVTELSFEGYMVYEGKRDISPMPSTYSEGDAQTLEIYLRDKRSNLKVTLLYTVFCKYDAICRSIIYKNESQDDIYLLSAQSATVDISGTNYEMLHLCGDWARERHIERIPVNHARCVIDSKRGMSGHMENPFIALLEKNAGEYMGEVFGFSLVYSGSFTASAEGTSCGKTRVTMGINDFNFEWRLASGEEFMTPEVVMAYSPCGLSRMSGIYHRLYRDKLCRGRYRGALRPMLINNWEGTTFDFDEKKLIDIAREGADLGLELFVLDDGWFAKRNGACSLGDWYVNTDKLPRGLEYLAKEVNALGMKFGLWFEPEMISPDSDLYRAHPDWCVHAKGRRRTENRSQLVLDISREEVREYILDTITKVLQSANIEYVKWDCNRTLTETSSMEQPHRYVIGLYKMLDTLTTRFPDILFESCAGGGGRFDPGILCYMPQTWTSDNTDPIARLAIQYGTSIVYPPITMGSHVGSIAVGMAGENQFLNTCAMAAMSGNFGYELDLNLFSEAEKAQAKSYVDLYRKIRPTIQYGEFYRLESPFEGDNVSWMFVDSDRAVLFTFQTKKMINGEERRVKLRGLDENALYEYNGERRTGAELMLAGVGIALERYEYASRCRVYEVIKK